MRASWLGLLAAVLLLLGAGLGTAAASALGLPAVLGGLVGVALAFAGSGSLLRRGLTRR